MNAQVGRPSAIALPLLLLWFKLAGHQWSLLLGDERWADLGGGSQRALTQLSLSAKGALVQSAPLVLHFVLTVQWCLCVRCCCPAARCARCLAHYQVSSHSLPLARYGYGGNKSHRIRSRHAQE